MPDEVDELKRNAKLIGSLARQLPGLDVDKARTILERVEVEVHKWLIERQSAQDLLRMLSAQVEEQRLEIRMLSASVFNLMRYLAKRYPDAGPKQ
jgi:hypothetical protein